MRAGKRQIPASTLDTRIKTLKINKTTIQTRLKSLSMGLSATKSLRFAGFAGFSEFAQFTGAGPRSHRWVSVIFIELEMARALLFLSWIVIARRNHRTMSCRIDRVVSAENLIVLFISGRITGEHVEMLREVLEKEADALAIDLKNVSLVAREAVKLLARCETNGTELRNCPPYIREWVTRERAERKTRRSEQGL